LPSNYKYITHHATKYHNVPLWVAINAITFGQVSKLYQYVPNDVQYKISQQFEHVTERQLHQFMRVLTSCRNVCAHGERLYSFSINETISDTALHKKLAIPLANGQYALGKHDLFSVVIALRYLLDASDFKIHYNGSVVLLNH
jgi:abortive infection bacteriophage resistance protein